MMPYRLRFDRRFRRHLNALPGDVRGDSAASPGASSRPPESRLSHEPEAHNETLNH